MQPSNKNLLYKTQLCQFFSTPKGCPKGAKCVYAHGKGELRRMTDPIPQKKPKTTKKEGKVVTQGEALAFFRQLCAKSDDPIQMGTVGTFWHAKFGSKSLQRSFGVSSLTTIFDTKPFCDEGHSPLEVLRNHPHLVAVRLSEGKNRLYPPTDAPSEYALPATNVVTLQEIIPQALDAPAATSTMMSYPDQSMGGESLETQNSAVPSGVVQIIIGGTSILLVDSLVACDKARGELLQCSRLAVDCEGVNLSRDGRLTLVQIGTGTTVYLFDVVAFSDIGGLEALSLTLRSILSNYKIQKVMHDCRRDSEALHFQLGIDLKNVIDTQVLYAMHAAVERTFGSSSSQDDMRRIGLNKLLTIAGLATNKCKQAIAIQMDLEERFWEIRPMSEDMLAYAAADVAQLLPLQDWLQELVSRSIMVSASRLSEGHVRWFLGAGTPERVPQGTIFNLKFDAKNQAAYEEFEDQIYDKTPTSRLEEAENLEFNALLDVLPPLVCATILGFTPTRQSRLMEIVLHAYQSPVLRFDGDSKEQYLESELTCEDMEDAVERILRGRKHQEVFSTDNRAGLPGCLHRISALRDRSKGILGLTYRVGRYVCGAGGMIRDLLAKVDPDHSVLLLGRPGVGKTTLLRDVTMHLSVAMSKRVVVVDTSNEIAGDHPKPHPCIGRATRMQVDNRHRQHEVLIEAVQNHSPQVIVVDEIGTSHEVDAARTIAQRGVGMIGTAHGISLRGLLKNPVLRPLIGGVQVVTLGDAEAKKRSKQRKGIAGKEKDNHKPISKTQLERAGAPTFGIVVELLDRQRWRIYHNVAQIVDELLQGQHPIIEERWMDGENMFARFERLPTEALNNATSSQPQHWFDELRQSVSQE